ncbi:polysaccharide biosynthesis protein [Iamia sp. SCSIO 61187]|uniref:oligosaccharide flippase family protein n=1 Tax=Iamia sp. SCSIO 61187 TaxID=2722752 RepID=UPI001C6320BA|nr:oligosaccharide flippase family protein [Iamia sp. SCSIO 61187]QYG92246.1 polysaccharide biosynthesis protein [Iamia sp. SCSIO 61187]
MSATPAAVDEPAAPRDERPGHGAVEGQIRGSSLLLVGRLASMAANMAIQVLVVRALARSDYGLFAYAMSVVTVLATIVTFGLDRGLARFIVVFEEERDYPRLWGTIVMQVTTILGLGAAAAVVAIGFQGWVGETVVADPRLAQLLAVMVLLAPLQALDSAAASLFAAFGRSKAIFFRRYVLTPVLRLGVAGLVLLTGGGVVALGAGYVLVGLVGVAVYGSLLVRAFRDRGLLDDRRARSREGIRLPLREIGAFTVPLLLSDAMFVVLNTSDVAILGRTHGADAVAAYRSVLPLAHLNQVVMNSFALLAGPLMARMWARRDRTGLATAYWRTAAWVAVLTFPIAAITVGLADPVVALLFGARYDGSGTYLAILAAAFYANAALGFNGVTVKMVGRVWLIAGTAGAALVINLVLNALLIPAHGALGATWGTAGSVVAYNLLKHLALRRATGVELLPERYASVYLTIGIASTAIVASAVVDLPLPVALVVVAASSGAVLWVGRRELAVDAMFPELLRIPLLGRFVAPGRR